MTCDDVCIRCLAGHANISLFNYGNDVLCLVPLSFVSFENGPVTSGYL